MRRLLVAFSVVILIAAPCAAQPAEPPLRPRGTDNSRLILPKQPRFTLPSSGVNIGGGLLLNRGIGFPPYSYYDPYYFSPFHSVYVITPPVYQPVFVPVYTPSPPIERIEPPRVIRNPPGNAEPAAPPPPKAKDDLDQRADAQKLIRAGNEAFAEAQYQQAAKRYDQAVLAAPLEPMPYFHLAQAQIALGKYAEASVSIQRGLRINPQWPATPFQPKLLYRDRLGEYQQHLAQLADLVGKNLNDDALMFLLGYQLWFDERRDEAIVLFERAAALAFETTHIERFLKAAKPPLAGQF